MINTGLYKENSLELIELYFMEKTTAALVG
jgi:hypothetical protein